jgi:hypothetical protein
LAQFERGDHIKVEFQSEIQNVPGEWMWVLVHYSDDERQIVFGTLDNEPVLRPDDVKLGEELAISYERVREHSKGLSILR